MRSVLLILCLLAANAEAQVNINPGMSGSWFNPATPGQGMLIDVIPHRNEVVIGWFTFESNPSFALGAMEQRWFTAEGGFSGNRADLVVYNSSGGRFNSSTPVTTEPAGSATLVFQSCTRAKLIFAIDDGPGGEISLSRLSPDAYCAVFAATNPLPLFFVVSGDASGEDEEGYSAECHFNLIYELSESSRLPGVVEYVGHGGGDVGRSVRDPSGAGFDFFADFFIPDVEARVVRGNQLELDGPGRGVDDSRLYLNLARFIGTLEASGTAEGEWTCGPFDVDVGGYVDVRTTVRGTWQIQPLDDGTRSGFDLRWKNTFLRYE